MFLCNGDAVAFDFEAVLAEHWVGGEEFVETDLAGAHARMAALAEAGVDLSTVTSKLLDDGVAAFAKAFEGLLASVEQKAKRLAG